MTTALLSSELPAGNSTEPTGHPEVRGKDDGLYSGSLRQGDDVIDAIWIIWGGGANSLGTSG